MRKWLKNDPARFFSRLRRAALASFYTALSRSPLKGVRRQSGSKSSNIRVPPGKRFHIKTFPEASQMGQLLDFCQKIIFVLCGAPPRTTPYPAPLRSSQSLGSVSRIAQLRDLYKNLGFVLCGAPPRTTPSPAPLRSLRAWSPFRDFFKKHFREGNFGTGNNNDSLQVFRE